MRTELRQLMGQRLKFTANVLSVNKTYDGKYETLLQNVKCSDKSRDLEIDHVWLPGIAAKVGAEVEFKAEVINYVKVKRGFRQTEYGLKPITPVKSVEL